MRFGSGRPCLAKVRISAITGHYLQSAALPLCAISGHPPLHPKAITSHFARIQGAPGLGQLLQARGDIDPGALDRATRTQDGRTSHVRL